MEKISRFLISIGWHLCFCDLLLNRPTATWNLFVLYNKELNFIRIKADGDVNRASVL